MDDLKNINFYKDLPVKEFTETGVHKYRPGLSWERNYKHSSLYFISEGTLKFFLKDRVIVAEKNDVIFLKGSEIATVKNETNSQSSFYFIAFYPNENAELNIPEISKDTSYFKLFKGIWDAYLSKLPLGHIKISHLLLELIYSLASDKFFASEEYQQNSAIHKVAKYISTHYYKNISQEQLCEMAGYSPAHLRRLFVKVFGVSPQQYILNCKIDRAKELLLHIPEQTVEEISDMLGFCSSSYFCRLFKSKVGLSPVEYKNSVEKRLEI